MSCNNGKRCQVGTRCNKKKNLCEPKLQLPVAPAIPPQAIHPVIPPAQCGPGLKCKIGTRCKKHICVPTDGPRVSPAPAPAIPPHVIHPVIPPAQCGPGLKCKIGTRCKKQICVPTDGPRVSPAPLAPPPRARVPRARVPAPRAPSPPANLDALQLRLFNQWAQVNTRTFINTTPAPIGHVKILSENKALYDFNKQIILPAWMMAESDAFRTEYMNMVVELLHFIIDHSLLIKPSQLNTGSGIFRSSQVKYTDQAHEYKPFATTPIEPIWFATDIQNALKYAVNPRQEFVVTFRNVKDEYLNHAQGERGTLCFVSISGNSVPGCPHLKLINYHFMRLIIKIIFFFISKSKEFRTFYELRNNTVMLQSMGKKSTASLINVLKTYGVKPDKLGYRHSFYHEDRFVVTQMMTIFEHISQYIKLQTNQVVLGSNHGNNLEILGYYQPEVISALKTDPCYNFLPEVTIAAKFFNQYTILTPAIGRSVRVGNRIEYSGGESTEEKFYGIKSFNYMTPEKYNQLFVKTSKKSNKNKIKARLTFKKGFNKSIVDHQDENKGFNKMADQDENKGFYKTKFAYQDENRLFAAAAAGGASQI